MPQHATLRAANQHSSERIVVSRYIARRFELRGVTICLPGPHGWQRHHSGERPVDIDSTRLDSALAAASQVEQAVARHKLQIDVGTEKMLVRVNPRLTSAALAHLLENAGQYSPAGSTITVRVALSPDELQITVGDRGVGIAPEDLDRLFERSYRGADARQQRFGTGMGLAITRGLLAAERGRVWAENHPEGGAIFTIAVPAESRPTAVLEGEGL